jgi:hypothetical protein
MKNAEIAADLNLWNEYYNVSALMTDEEFEAASYAERLAMLIESFGDDEDGGSVAEGSNAIELAERTTKVQLNKYTDPTEEACEDISISAAREIAREDPGLIYATVRRSIQSLGGKVKSPAKTAAARVNGQKGGRPAKEPVQYLIYRHGSNSANQSMCQTAILGTVEAMNTAEAKTLAADRWSCYNNQCFEARHWRKCSAEDRETAFLADAEYTPADGEKF